MKKQLKRWASATRANAMLNDDSGAALVEYGMLVGLIACVCIAGVTLLGTQVNAVFTAITGALAPVIAAIAAG